MLFTDPDYAHHMLMNSKDLHTIYRSILNSNVPNKLQEITENWEMTGITFQQLPWYQSIFHFPILNTKWVSTDGGHLGGVYDRYGDILGSSILDVTFNIYGPSDVYGYIKADILPYLKWGN